MKTFSRYQSSAFTRVITITTLAVIGSALSGCGSGETKAANAKAAALDNPSERAKDLQSNSGVPPQAKAEMLSNLQKQGQPPASPVTPR